MSTSDLLTHPLWQADTLGSPLPDHDFGVSVSLPLWKHVIGYEEKDPEVVSKFRSGYPRFCCPPAVSQLFAAAEKQFAGDAERCIVFPRLIHARRCLDFIARHGGFTGRALAMSTAGTPVASEALAKEAACQVPEGAQSPDAPSSDSAVGTPLASEALAKEAARPAPEGAPSPDALSSHSTADTSSPPEPLGVAVFPAEAYDTARRFWRFCGEVVSTRQSCDALGLTKSTATEEQGRAATATIRQRLASVAGQQPEDVFLFPSGMAANYAVHRMLTALFPARKTAQLDFPYVDVLKLQQIFGSGAHFLPLVNDSDYDQLRTILTHEPLSGIFCEAPSNPMLRCADFQRLLAIRAETRPDTPLIVDDTISTVAHVNACRVADVVTASLTKSFSGVGDVLAGSVILNRASPHHPAFSAFLTEHADHTLWRGDAVALEQNSRDFVQRAGTMSRNALALAEHLRAHPKVERVWHAKWEGGPGYEFVRRPDGGYGCLFSFLLKDAEKTSPPFYDALRVCKGPSLGTNFTLVCPYTLLAHYDELEWAATCGVPSHLIRVSAGLEDTADLIARFEEALAK